MGDVRKARLRFKGKVFDGDAMLETTELVFRGRQRLAIPLDKVTSVKAKDGRLTVTFGGASASLDLGPQANEWAERISNPKSVVQKLGIRPGYRVSVVNLDDPGFLRDLHGAGAQVHEGRTMRGSNAIIYGASKRPDLRRLASLKDHLASDGALWVIRPKGVKDITESDVMGAGRSAGLVDVKVVRFSETHTAEKFVIPVAQRRK
jgi:hypothetical protein